MQPPSSGSLKNGASSFAHLQENDTTPPRVSESSAQLQESDEPSSCRATGHKPPSPDRAQDKSGPALKKLKLESTWNLKAVLDKAVTWNIPKVQVVKAQVLNVKQTSALVKKLNEVLPLPTLQHLKRVKSVKNGDKPVINILLCLAKNCDNLNNMGPRLTELGVDTEALTDEFTLAEVAENPPFTRIQFNQLREDEDYWPCHFHEDKYLESLVNGTHELWSTTNRDKQHKFMERAKEVGGGVVVDPTSDTVIAAGHGTVHLHPLHHGVMNLVDLVARSQGGGASPHTAGVSPHTAGVSPHTAGALPHTAVASPHTAGASPHTAGVSPQTAGASPHTAGASPHTAGASPHTAGVSTFYYKSTETSNKSDQNGANPGAVSQSGDAPSGGFYNLLKRYGSIGQLSEVPKTGPYLCTGYDVYLLREPCAMCAMALLHMRTRRVFYAFPTRDGVLGSNGTMHTLEGLNHRYEVFCNILNYEPTAAATEFCT